jgi:DNA segregation ATPase FtsK/SpoIIIE-like protein
MYKYWNTPTMQYYDLYADMLKQPHLLIAGATGSGKSVIINGIIITALQHSPAAVQFILIDPKRVELSEYRTLPHCIEYASEPGTIIAALHNLNYS